MKYLAYLQAKIKRNKKNPKNSIQTVKDKNEKFLQLFQGTPVVKTSGWIKFTPSKYFQLDKKAKRKQIEAVDCQEKPGIPKIPAIKMRERWRWQ